MTRKTEKMTALCGKVGKEPYIYGIEISNTDGVTGALLYQFKGCRDFKLEGCLARSPNAQNHKPFIIQEGKRMYTDISDSFSSGKHCEDLVCTEKYHFLPGTGSPKDHEFDLAKATTFLKGRLNKANLSSQKEPVFRH